jgi:transposase
MWIIGCDFHPSFQQVAIFDKATGEVSQRRLRHVEEAREFYASLAEPVLVGVEACGHTPWFEQWLAQLGHELWMGDAARIRSLCWRQQKTDRRDAAHLLELLLTERFPRLWVPTAGERDVRQLLIHRHQRVRLRTQAKNQLHALALNQGLQKKYKLWTQAGREQLQAWSLLPYAAQRRQQLLATLDRLEAEIVALDRQVEQEAGAAAGSGAADDPSRSRPADGAGVCADHR